MYAYKFKYDTIETKNKPAIMLRWSVTTTKQNHIPKIKQSRDYVHLFDGLVNQWKAETLTMSSLGQMTALKSFKDITAMREKVLPLIYRNLQKQPSWLVVAGIEIAGENPTPAAAQGNIIRIVDAWLRWAERTGADVN